MKRLKKLFIVGMTALALSACANEPATMTDIHTGISAGTSKRYSVYEGLLTSIYAQSFVATKGSATKQGIYIHQLATGMGWSFYNEAYSFGTQLPYSRGNSTVLGCSSAGCSNSEEGAVQLSMEQFSRAATSGFEMKLVGSGRSVVIRMPAEAFREALAYRPNS